MTSSYAWCMEDAKKDQGLVALLDLVVIEIDCKKYQDVNFSWYIESS